MKSWRVQLNSRNFIPAVSVNLDQMTVFPHVLELSLVIPLLCCSLSLGGLDGKQAVPLDLQRKDLPTPTYFILWISFSFPNAY